MIETRNVNLNAQNHDNLTICNNFHLKPNAEKAMMKSSQFLVKPSVVADSVRSKIVFNTRSPETKNGLKVINFSPKFDSPPPVQVSKSLERPVTFNNPVHNPF